MRPTIDDQLHGAHRLLSAVIDDDTVSEPARLNLVNARRLLEQVGRSWAVLPAFYAEDNRSLAALLERTRPGLPDAAAARIATAVADPGPPATDVAAAAERNAELRALLSLALRELSDDTAADAARTDIADYLARRVAIDPA